MSLSCFLPKLCVAKKMRRPAGDDRPFHEEDYLVFPQENMYDRIVLHDICMEGAKSQKVANYNIHMWQNRNNESPFEIEGN